MPHSASTIPTSMTAVEIAGTGETARLIPVARPVPVPEMGEVLIAIEAAGINRPDVFQRQGNYPPPPGVTDIPGLEVAGTIVRIGLGAHGFAVGDKVCALLAGGGYAQYATAPAVQCLPIPAGLSMVEAASLPETFFTVWPNLMERGRLAAGETVLIHGGTSGIGVAAIQIAKAFGARVLATAGSYDKAHRCEALGAERGINYAREDFVAVVRALTQDRGVDLILDMVGGDYVARNIAAAALDGRLVSIAFLRGARVELDLSQIMRKRLVLTGSTLRNRTPEVKGAIAETLRAKVWPLLAAGTIKPVIHATFPLAEAGAAQALMESSAHVGKIVLTV